MKLFFFILFSHGFVFCALHHSDALVRVLVHKTSDPIEFELENSKGAGNIFAQGLFTSHWAIFGKKAHIQKMGSPWLPSFQINSTNLRADSVSIKATHQKLKWRGVSYPGEFHIIRKGSEIWVINVASVEDYLTGILAKEMNASWDLEALKAQAVASRSYALYMIKNPKSREYDIEATQMDQVYDGLPSAASRIHEAVRTTMGQRLTYRNQITKTLFHSRCGGTTEIPEAIWGSSMPGYQRKACPYCQQNPYNWSLKFPIESLKNKLSSYFSHFENIFNLTPTLGSSGRVFFVDFFSGLDRKRFRAEELRNLLGYDKLKSSFFTCKISGNELKIEGHGYGHGVGMCQFGARYFAQTGKDYKGILDYYYPEFELKNAIDVSKRF